MTLPHEPLANALSSPAGASAKPPLNSEIQSAPDSVFNAREAARYLGLATATCAKLRCRGGSPPYLKMGRKIGYRKSDLDTWLAARRVRNTIEAGNLPRRLTDEKQAA